MKKLYIAAIFLSVTCLAIADIMEKTGKAARTGSPGEFDCTGCHTSFVVNSGPGSISISSPNLTNWMYVPGQTYQIDVTVAQTGVSLFGFGFEALRTSNNTNAGTFTITNSVETQLKSATVGGTPRTNVVHKENGGLTADTHTFSFNWTAPATNIGNVKFWTAGNAANNQNDSLGDYIYKTSQVVTPFVTGIDEVNNPVISILPNPAASAFQIKGLNFQAGDIVEVTDVTGKLVYRQTVSTKISDMNVQTTNFKNGMYLIKYNTANLHRTSKVLIIH